MADLLGVPAISSTEKRTSKISLTLPGALRATKTVQGECKGGIPLTQSCYRFSSNEAERGTTIDVECTGIRPCLLIPRLLPTASKDALSRSRVENSHCENCGTDEITDAGLESSTCNFEVIFYRTITSLNVGGSSILTLFPHRNPPQTIIKGTYL